MPRYDAEWIATMLEPDRRGSLPAEEILTSLGVTPGQIIADVGCGPGFFTLPAARLVSPGGLVYAIDIEPSMLELVQSRARLEGVEGIETRQANGLSIPIEDARADLTLCGLVLHDLSDRQGFVRELVRITKPGGKIAIVEWQVESGKQSWNRLSPEEVRDLLARAGRPSTDVRPLGARQYLVVAR